MTFRLQLVAIGDSGQEQVQEIARLEREGVQLETLGLTLAEGKLVLKNVQESVIQKQVHESLTRQRCCPDCGKLRQCKGHHDVTFRTLFGNVELKSPRLHHCPCRPHAEKSFSPLQGSLPEHMSPELRYLEVGARCWPMRPAVICCMMCCPWTRN